MGFQVIGLAGGSGEGKDFLAAHHFRNLGFLPIALADELKARAIAEGRFTWEECYVTKPEAYRTWIQQEATERTRDVLGEDYWIRLLWARFQTDAWRWGKDVRYVITDVRFANEISWITAHGGHVIRVHAPLRWANNGLTTAQRLHRSEAQLRDIPLSAFHAVVDNNPGREQAVGLEIRTALRNLGYLPELDGMRLGMGTVQYHGTETAASVREAIMSQLVPNPSGMTTITWRG